MWVLKRVLKKSPIGQGKEVSRYSSHAVVYPAFDYLVWLLSSRSDWLPRSHHAYLLQGMKEWTIWPWSGKASDSDYDDTHSGVWQDLIRLSPGNLDGISALGGTFLRLKRYSEAADLAESAIKIRPDRANLYALLGTSYMFLGSEDKATDAFKKALEIDPRPFMFNNVAYTMAEANKSLSLSLEYAQRAVKQEETASANMALSSLTLDDLARMSRLAAYWDTLGWVHFKIGNLEQAEKYVDASLRLSESTTVRDHLIEIRKKRGPHAQKSLEDSSTLRTVKLSRLVPGEASAEFFVVLSRAQGTSEGKVEEVKFIKGSDELKSADRTLKSAKFSSVFPDDGPTRLVRRGILGCYAYTGCSFVMLYANDVHSLD